MSPAEGEEHPADRPQHGGDDEQGDQAGIPRDRSTSLLFGRGGDRRYAGSDALTGLAVRSASSIKGCIDLTKQNAYSIIALHSDLTV